ncbi:putative T7SS-secreted protein [Streptomyces sp. NPDC002851]
MSYSYGSFEPGHSEQDKAAFPALGFNPCPGDWASADWIADSVRRAAKALGDIQQVLRGTGRGEWRGKAADKFREQFDDDFRPKIDKAEDSFSRSASALEDWASYMKPKQKRAHELEELAQAAKKRAEEAKGALSALGDTPSGEPKGAAEEKERKRLEERRGDAKKAAGDTEEALEDIRRQARDLADTYRERGEEIADRLKRALDIAPNEPGWLEKIGEALGRLDDLIGKALDAAMAEIKQFLKENAWLFKMIGDIAGTLSAIVGLLSLAFPVLGPIALGLGALALGSHYLMAVGTTGSFTKALTDETVLLDAAGLAFGGGAFAAGKALTKIAGPGTAGFFKTVITQPGRAMGGMEMTASVMQFTGNWMGNAVGFGPGGAAQNIIESGKYVAPGDQTPGPGKDEVPAYLDPEEAKKATR